jgi:hypothetical protein
MPSGTLVASPRATQAKEQLMTEDKRDARGDAPNERERGSETIPGRSFAGASYAATEKEQTDDARGKNDAKAGDVADGGISEELNDDGRP